MEGGYTGIYLYVFDGSNVSVFCERAGARHTRGPRASQTRAERKASAGKTNLLPSIWYSSYLEHARTEPCTHKLLRESGVSIDEAVGLAEGALGLLPYVPEFERDTMRGGAGFSACGPGGREVVMVWAYAGGAIGSASTPPEPAMKDVMFYLGVIAVRGGPTEAMKEAMKDATAIVTVNGLRVATTNLRGFDFSKEHMEQCKAVIPGRLHDHEAVVAMEREGALASGRQQGAQSRMTEGLLRAVVAALAGPGEEEPGYTAALRRRIQE